ncbi:MAG: hypothetical protein ACLP8X_38610 [Streptosporangiaceae bacterium]
MRRLIAAIRDNDERKVEEAVLQLARTRRIFAPLALAVGAFVMLFNGLRLLVTNWRLMLVQVLPAMWIWAATYDLKRKSCMASHSTTSAGRSSWCSSPPWC